jgi:hypothetical protein
LIPVQPFAHRLFVPYGIPEGPRIVDKSNWSGIGIVVVPRFQPAESLCRPEAFRLRLGQRAVEKHLAALQRAGRLRRHGFPRAGNGRIL